MDAGVDAAETKPQLHNFDEVGPAQELQSQTFMEQRLHGQNRWFSVGLLAFLVLAVVLVNKLYAQEDVLESNSGQLDSLQHQNQHHLNSTLQHWKSQKDKYHHTAKPHQPHNGNDPHDTMDHPPVLTELEIQDWLQARVTLQDGPKFVVLGQIVHDKSFFLEGLTYDSATNRLFESVGLNGHSKVLELDPDTGDVVQATDMESVYFAEGLTYVHDTLVQLTYKAKKGFVWDPNTWQTLSTFNFDTTKHEGWGLTYDPDRNELIVSDGSHYLHYWDPETFQELRKVAVTRQGGAPATNMNELEYFRGRVLCNVWFQDVILVIHPETGVVEKEYNFASLWKKDERRHQGAGVLNGISVSKHPDLLYVTGKNWDKMFLVKLLV